MSQAETAVCERCKNASATDHLFRSGTLLVGDDGRILAEIEARVALCRPCWEAVVHRGEPLPEAKIIRRFS